MTHDISVIIPTYNRASDLRRTLEGMAKMDRSGLSIEFIVVDNDSTDQTKYVIDSFSDRLPIQYFFEPHSGKNRALNFALENAKLGDIVVFTDDDVDVSADWLVSIASICSRHPNHSVFGGRINVIFPDENVPKWASDGYIKPMAFAYHNYSTIECVYEDRGVPFGPNYWVRRSVFDNGRRFDEAIGPHPTNRILGDETKFLLDLLNDGYEIIFSPRAIVSHRIQPEILKFSAICKRAYQTGRGYLHIRGLPQRNLLNQHRAVWHLYRMGAIIWNALKVLSAMTFSSKGQRLPKCAKKILYLGYQIEAMRMTCFEKKINSENDGEN